ncbi:MAG: ribonuclease III [Clostridia bacterium]|nr:ribonuclease III [Clostridia bacterium]
MLSLIDIEKKIGYVFKNKELLKTALTHKSYAYERTGEDVSKYNERLEFLGDAILEHIVSIYLYNVEPKLKEGVMSKKRAEIVCEASLSRIIRERNLAKDIRLGKCEINTGGNKKDAILADMFEAILGAVYLDGGYDEANRVCLDMIKSTIDYVVAKEDTLDYKTRLQEILQRNGNVKIEYVLEKEQGKDHAKMFFSAVYFNDKKIGEGSGKTKKLSEQNAAKQAIEKIKD